MQVVARGSTSHSHVIARKLTMITLNSRSGVYQYLHAIYILVGVWCLNDVACIYMHHCHRY